VFPASALGGGVGGESRAVKVIGSVRSEPLPAGTRLPDVSGVSGFPVVYYVRSSGVISKVTIGAATQRVVDSLMAAIAG
jgi:hypothetical protein